MPDWFANFPVNLLVALLGLKCVKCGAKITAKAIKGGACLTCNKSLCITR